MKRQALDGRGQFSHVTDQPVGFEFDDWDVRISKLHADHRNAGAAGHSNIRTGITDHTVTELAQVLSGQLNEGDQVVTGAMTAAASSGSRPPGMGGGGAPRR